MPAAVTPAVGSGDEHSDSMANATFATIGSTQQGTINANADRDFFRVDLQADVAYAFTLTIGSKSTAGLEIVDSRGNLLKSFNGVPSRPIPVYLEPPTSGSYYLVASGRESSTYQLSTATVPDDFPNNKTTTGRVVVGGGAVGGQVQFAGDRDRFLIDVAAGLPYRVAVTTTTEGQRIVPNVFDASGARVSGKTFDDQHTSAVVFVPLLSGTYFVETHAGDSTRLGAYRIEALVADDFGDTPATAAPVLVGATVSAEIGHPADRDVFRIDLEAGQPYLFEVQSTGTGSKLDGMALSLVDVAGGVLARGETLRFAEGHRERIILAPRTTGAYYLVAESTAARPTGTYLLTIDRGADDFGNTSATAGHLTLGQALIVRHEYESDVDRLAIDLRAGIDYSISVESALAGTLSVIGPAEERLASTLLADDKLAVLPFTPRVDGTYYLESRLSGSIARGYVVSANTYEDDYPSARPGAVRIGTPVDGVIEIVGDSDRFEVDLVAGQAYAFRLRAWAHERAGKVFPLLLDSVLELYGPGGERLARGEDKPATGFDRFAEIIVIAPRSGTFTLLTQGDGGASGGYRLFSEAADLDGPKLTEITPAAGGSTARNAEFRLFFDEAVQPGVGFIDIRDRDSGALMRRYDVQDIGDVAVDLFSPARVYLFSSDDLPAGRDSCSPSMPVRCETDPANPLRA